MSDIMLPYDKQMKAMATQLIRAAKNSYRYAVEPTEEQATSFKEEIEILLSIGEATKEKIELEIKKLK